MRIREVKTEKRRFPLALLIIGICLLSLSVSVSSGLLFYMVLGIPRFVGAALGYLISLGLVYGGHAMVERLEKS